MPLHLEALDVSDRLRNYRSVLIVSCPICPPASLASDCEAPFIEFFKHGIRTPAYEKHLDGIREQLDDEGIRTGTFTSYLPCAAACLWTQGQRKRLRNKARNYDAAIVMGCESARQTVEDALENVDCDVLLAMELVGITNAKLKFEFPFTIKLEDLSRVGANERIGHAR